MNASNNISDAGLYTEFSGLQKLRSQVSGNKDTAESREATQAVAKQFESVFLQMMLKSMRDATTTGDSAESDQTRFYQEMFDKQIALDLASSGKGGGLGIAAMLEKDLGPGPQNNLSDNVEKDLDNKPVVDNFELIRNQMNRSAASIQTKHISEQE